MQYQPYDRTYRCGGWGSYHGPCGADDCEDCNPGCNSLVSTTRDLQHCGYEFDQADGCWHKVIEIKTHMAKKQNAKHGMEPGTRYRRITARSIDDSTGDSFHYSRIEAA